MSNQLKLSLCLEPWSVHVSLAYGGNLLKEKKTNKSTNKKITQLTATQGGRVKVGTLQMQLLTAQKT